MTYVWVLVFYVAGGNQAGGPAVIDNIATKEECVRIQSVLQDDDPKVRRARCIQVGKVKP